MKRECPEWAAKIGVEVRLLTEDTRCETPSITSLLRQIDESEASIIGGEGASKVDAKRSH